MAMDSNTLYDLLERFNNLLRAEERLNGMQFSLQPVHLHVLNYLSICNEYSDTPAGVTGYLRLTKGTVSQTITVLVKNGLLIKKSDSKDKRLQHLKLTTKGEKILKKIVPAEVFSKAIGNLSSDDKIQFEKTLKELLSLMQSENGSSSFGVCNSCSHFITKGDSDFCGITELPLNKIQINKICKEHR